LDRGSKAASTEQSAGKLDRRIGAFIDCPDPTDAEFEELAIELFGYQYQNNPPYRALCDQRDRSPSNVKGWRDVPAVSAASFADARIACFPAERTVVRFVSSGTARNSARPSVHELENTTLYDSSLLAHFRRCVIPDRDSIRMVLLSPPFEEAPQSSLVYMLMKVYSKFGRGGGFFIHNGELDTEGIAAALRGSREPVLVFGTSFAFVHFLDHCAQSGSRFALAASSRIIETGGFKGKSRSVEREELYGGLSRVFGVPHELCSSEYGMCELGSQWYDASLSDALASREPREQLKIGPHWARTLVVDPVTGQELPSGAIGLLQCYDLSNRGSVAAVLTGDLVLQRDGGFVYIGRSKAAPPKGCSITVDTALRPRV
jgi:hypothetical protein